MDSEMLIHMALLLIGVFISAVSQVMLKKAAKRQYDSIFQEYLNPRVVIAYVLFVGTTFLSIFAYSVVPLSMGPILEATGYIYITFFGVRSFKEKITIKKIEALGFIIAGIIVYVWLG